jgi:ubiquinone biosynthesis protein COQ9
MEKNRKIFMQSFLKNAVFEGWGNTNFNKTAAELFEYGYIEAIFPDGINSFNQYVISLIDDAFVRNIKKIDISKLKHREKVSNILNIRIKTLHDFFGSTPKSKEVFKKFIANFSLQPVKAITSHFEAVDSFWHLAGDKSADFSYYTKRLTLSYIYSSAIIYSLNDASENFTDTQKFIERRIDDVMKINNIKAKLKSFGELKWKH